MSPCGRPVALAAWIASATRWFSVSTSATTAGEIDISGVRTGGAGGALAARLGVGFLATGLVISALTTGGFEMGPDLDGSPRHDWRIGISWRGLFALAANDLGIHLISAGIKQIDGPVFQRPKVAVQSKVVFADADALTRDQLRGFESYRCCLYRSWLASRAGRQAKADQPTYEQPGFYA